MSLPGPGGGRTAPPGPVTVLAATGPVGRALVRRLAGAGQAVIAIGRDPVRLAGLPAACEVRVADFADPSALRQALAGAQRVAMCANAIHLPAVLEALPAAGVRRLAVMGSTRCYSAVPDPTALAVRAAAAALAGLTVPNILLLATMIYGTGHGVLDRLARLRLVPVPAGALLQPIHVDDVAACLEAGLLAETAPGPPVVIAGPVPHGYGRLVRGRQILVVPVPRLVLAGLGRLLDTVGRGAGLRRLAESRTFEIAAMRARLGVDPRPFDPAA